jgi:hypothetical protein
MLTFDWIRQNGELLGWLGAVSVLTFFGTIAAVPLFLIALPADYLSGTAAPISAAWPGPVRWIYRIGKNAVGGVLLVAGVAMLVLPGQGLLTIFVGLVLTDIPAKRRLLRRALGGRAVFDKVNRLRERAGRPPLSPP